MPEEQNVIGEQWTLESVSLLKHLGWSLHGQPNFDITCSQKTHKARSHGVDALLSYYDPYINRKNGVILESKSRKWESINTRTMSQWLEQLTATLECANNAPEVKEFDCHPINTGLLTIWCNDNNYNHEKFCDYLKSLKLPNKRNPFIVYVLSNYDILRLCSIITTKQDIKREDNITNVSFYYPSINQSIGISNEILNLKYMFSEFIFLKAKKIQKFGDITIPLDITVVFYFGSPTFREINFMYSALKAAQLEDVNEIRIYFYGSEEEGRMHKSEFKQRKEEELSISQLNKNTKVKIMHMNQYSDIPPNIIRGRGYGD
ncbi:MAG: hypothetical protein H0Z24_10150 [Thermosipho sp. (in: Bacteria)]|nr:hypothetical protein [Thermosipho sp. (in: thermotogales)]